MKVPVIFIVFNRPEPTARVFERIRAARPPALYLVADGPRLGRTGEADRCQAVRAIVEHGIDWPCELIRDYSEMNLGCSRRVATGLNTAFTQFDEAIILEDDCLPDPSFFPFCEEMLKRYRDEPRVMVISGDNFQGPDWTCAWSYYFSVFPHCWGWATWKHAWQHSDMEMRGWTERRNSGWLQQTLGDAKQARYWRNIFDRMQSREIDAWDFPWTFSCWTHGGLTVLPAVNLVSNIGFGPDATHTRAGCPGGNLPINAMTFPLVHPTRLEPDRAADQRTSEILFRQPSFPRRLLRRVKRTLTQT